MRTTPEPLELDCDSNSDENFRYDIDLKLEVGKELQHVAQKARPLEHGRAFFCLREPFQRK